MLLIDISVVDLLVILLWVIDFLSSDIANHWLSNITKFRAV